MSDFKYLFCGGLCLIIIGLQLVLGQIVGFPENGDGDKLKANLNVSF